VVWFEAAAHDLICERDPVSPESLVEVDPVCGDTETSEDLALGGEVLQDG